MKFQNMINILAEIFRDVYQEIDILLIEILIVPLRPRAGQNIRHLAKYK